MKKTKIVCCFPFFALCVIFFTLGAGENFLCAIVFSLLHEAGHLGAMYCFGAVPECITIGVMGIKIEKYELSLKLSEECITALCGPVVNLIFAVIFFFKDASSVAFAANTGLFVINMLPVRTLDGGRFLFNFICLAKNEVTAQKVISVLEMLTVIFLVCVMLFTLFNGVFNESFVMFTLILTAVILFDNFNK